MRNMSFMLTVPQCRRKEKTVTRRQGWWFLKPGDFVQQVEKGQGLAKGEHVKKIHVVVITSTWCQRINAIRLNPLDVAREGFPGKSPEWFIEMYCRHNKVRPWDMCNRIEFEYVDMEEENAANPD